MSSRRSPIPARTTGDRPHADTGTRRRRGARRRRQRQHEPIAELKAIASLIRGLVFEIIGPKGPHRVTTVIAAKSSARPEAIADLSKSLIRNESGTNEERPWKPIWPVGLRLSRLTEVWVFRGSHLLMSPIRRRLSGWSTGFPGYHRPDWRDRLQSGSINISSHTVCGLPRSRRHGLKFASSRAAGNKLGPDRMEGIG
jgi:hypothetical protein